MYAHVPLYGTRDTTFQSGKNKNNGLIPQLSRSPNIQSPLDVRDCPFLHSDSLMRFRLQIEANKIPVIISSRATALTLTYRGMGYVV